MMSAYEYNRYVAGIDENSAHYASVGDRFRNGGRRVVRCSDGAQGVCTVAFGA